MVTPQQHRHRLVQPRRGERSWPSSTPTRWRCTVSPAPTPGPCTPSSKLGHTRVRRTDRPAAPLNCIDSGKCTGSVRRVAPRKTAQLSAHCQGLYVGELGSYGHARRLRDGRRRSDRRSPGLPTTDHRPSDHHDSPSGRRNRWPSTRLTAVNSNLNSNSNLNCVDPLRRCRFRCWHNAEAALIGGEGQIQIQIRIQIQISTDAKGAALGRPFFISGREFGLVLGHGQAGHGPFGIMREADPVDAVG